jgi:hypothetical protein
LNQIPEASTDIFPGQRHVLEGSDYESIESHIGYSDSGAMKMELVISRIEKEHNGGFWALKDFNLTLGFGILGLLG